MSQPEFTTVFLVFLRKGPNWTAESTPELEQLQAAHRAHLRALRQSGKIRILGPLLDNGDIRGVSLFRVPSLEEARALAEADPAVIAGRLVIEIHPWMVDQTTLLER
ncbi:MAG: hypothetical protein EXR62_14680 [Chloroflexi bacterium]|nr:hypothetical protein [Chloroflexota bacterium]